MQSNKHIRCKAHFCFIHFETKKIASKKFRQVLEFHMKMPLIFLNAHRSTRRWRPTKQINKLKKVLYINSIMTCNNCWSRHIITTKYIMRCIGFQPPICHNIETDVWPDILGCILTCSVRRKIPAGEKTRWKKEMIVLTYSWIKFHFILYFDKWVMCQLLFFGGFSLSLYLSFARSVRLVDLRAINFAGLH